MGTSSASLYSDDYASDIKADYIDRLRRGKTSEEATKELIYMNSRTLEDVEDGAIFWFALADTQWEYGRLVPDVKEKALEYLSRDEELERWRESDEEMLFAWMKTREQLRQKLLSPMPPEKKVSKYRLYKCKWQLGDVFAYRFDSEYSKEKGVYGQYIIFRKVSEDRWWPGHIVPSVHVYKWIGENIPTLDEIVKLPLLPQKYIPIAYVNNPNEKKEYMFNLLVSMEKQIPKDKLTFIGNIQGEDIVAYKDIANYYSGNAYTEWKDFEYKTLKQYFAWRVED